MGDWCDSGTGDNGNGTIGLDAFEMADPVSQSATSPWRRFSSSERMRASVPCRSQM
ncbi:hypothetical protein [Desulfonema magnum]|uniref:hypothetical protein n=1 Tax=Desulfonema magnum TaxID=45655 RepID=UPI001A9B477B|nr:hypothetical protein [Desulfonema magnum]